MTSAPVTTPGRAAGPAPAAAVVQVRDLVKTFGQVTACDRVSLSVAQGDRVALIGRSGSGKSTLLRLLNGLERPSSGEVRVLGTEVGSARGQGLRALRRRVGMVFQQFHLVGRLTAIENVLTGALGRVRGPRYGVLTWSRAQRREALEQLDRVGMGDRAFQRADTLSGGQQQRVAIARMLMQRPELLLADEPVASLDPESSAQVLEVLLRVSEEDRLTVVCSLHQVELALGWARRVVGLADGRVVLDQPAASLDRAEVDRVYRGQAKPLAAAAGGVAASAAAPAGPATGRVPPGPHRS